jgi:hypothetical protein
MSHRSIVGRLAAASLACFLCFGCASALAPTPQAVPPPPAKTQAQIDCEKAQSGQPASKDCTKAQ